MTGYDHQILVRLLAHFNDQYEATMTEDEKDIFANALVLVLGRLAQRPNAARS